MPFLLPFFMPITAHFSPTSCRLWQGFFIAGAPDGYPLPLPALPLMGAFMVCSYCALTKKEGLQCLSNDLPQRSHALPLSCRPAVPCPCEPCPAPSGLYSFGARWANAHFPAFWQYAIRPLDDFIFLANFYFLGIFSQEMSHGGGRIGSKLKYFMPLYAFPAAPCP